MRYVGASFCSAYIPKLLGLYERELHEVVGQVCGAPFTSVIDVGAAEGYYAVGFALRCPEARIIAFEADTSAREALREMALLNNVERRLDVRGKCEPRDLVQALTENELSLVLCDVEGYEIELLDPARVPRLRSATVLAELHEFLVPGVTRELRRRFEATHRIEQIWQQARLANDFPFSNLYTRLLPGRFIEWAVSEWRPERMSWLWMVPRQQ